MTPAQALLAIVPAEAKLEIEANVSNRDIGFVKAGQEAAIKVDTFNFTKYGLLSGRVQWLLRKPSARRATRVRGRQGRRNRGRERKQ